MTEFREAAAEVRLRAVEDGDLDAFFGWQADPAVTAMAAVPARDREAFDAHWAKIQGDGSVVLRTIVADGAAAGNITSWEENGQRVIGYLVGPEYWGRGIATRALARFAAKVTARPLRAHVAVRNAGSARVLEKNGFRRDLAAEAAAPPPEDGVDEYVFILDGRR